MLVIGPPLDLNGISYDPFHVSQRTVYVQLHGHSGLSPLHLVLRVRVFCISLSIFFALITMLHGLPPSIKDDIRDLDIYLPNQPLVKSFRPPPASFSRSGGTPL